MKLSLSQTLALAFALLAGYSQAQTVNYVTSLNDNGSGTLREVITNSFPGDTIRFSVTGAITITSGYLTWNKDLVIEGPGMTQLTISGNTTTQLFQILGGSLRLSDLTLLDGYVSSGNRAGGMNYTGGGPLTMENVKVEGCFGGGLGYSYGDGGAFRLFVPATMTNCQFIDNESEQPDGSARGGAIYSVTSLTLDNCTFSGNVADGDGDYNTDAKAYGGAVFVGNGNLTVTNSTFTSNTASGTNTYGAGGIYKKGYAYGGAIYMTGVSTFSCTNSTFTGNGSYGNGYGTSYDYSYGGAIYGSTSTYNLVNVDFINNTTGLGGTVSSNLGGTIYGGGNNVTMHDVMVNGSNNKSFALHIGATTGDIKNLKIAGTYSGGLRLSGDNYTVEQSLFENNGGPGLWITGANTDGNVINCTFTQNDALVGAGITVDGATNPAKITNCTFSENTSTTTNRGLELYVDNSSTAHLTNNIITIPSFTTDPLIEVAPGSSITSGGGNVVRDNSGSTYLTQPSDLNFTDPLMGTYANHGGLYNTYSITASSPAIDIQGAGTLTTDGRGYNRGDGSPDAGAFESGGTNPDLPLIYSFSEDTVICPGDSISLASYASSNAGPSFTYQWYYNGGAITGATDSIIHLDTCTAAGTPAYYLCVVTNAHGTDTDSALVSMNTPPTVDAGTGTAICLGGSATLTATGSASSYVWDNGAGSGTSVTVSPVSTTNYTVTGTDGNGCTAFDDVTVTVNFATANAGPDAEVCDGEGTNLNATGGTSYTWSPATGLNNPGSASPVATPANTTTYVVTVTDANTCVDTDSVTVTVNPNPVAPSVLEIGGTLSSSITATTYQWFLNGNAIAGETGKFYTPSQSGFYSVMITDGKGCSATSDDFSFDPAGINDIIRSTGLLVYPNPSSGVFNLRLTDAERDAQVIIRNVFGQIVYRDLIGRISQDAPRTIDLSEFVDGLYIIQMMSGSKLIGFQCLIIER